MRKKLFSFVKRRISLKKSQQGLSMPKLILGLFTSFLGIFIIGVLAVVIFLVAVVATLPSVHDLKTFVAAESTTIFDREGNLLYTIHGEENREVIPLADIPPYFIDATLAVEDDQFYTHRGFDVGGIIRAGLYEVFGIGRPRGGSTITQQFVKNTFLTSERTYIRKIKELILSVRLEQNFTKDEILEMYFNRIPYGSNAYGVQMAAKIFFGKEAKDITLAESAILAALPKAPSKFSPYGSNKELLMGEVDEEGDYTPGRKDYVLRRMYELNYIAKEEKDEAFEESNQVEFNKYREDIQHPHFVLWIKEFLEKKFGNEAVEAGGLRVYTTLDPRLQEAAERIVGERVAINKENYGANNAALLSVDIEKGQILAWVGSADYFDEEIDGNVNVVLRKRLPGSSFKPFVYAAAFLGGYSPATMLFDVETDFGQDYKPKNFDGTFSGPVSMRHALAYSLNIPAIKTAYLAGYGNVVDLAREAGIESLESPDRYGISIGLGTGETSLFEMVTGYSVLAKGGKKIDFTPLLRIENSQGEMIENWEDEDPEEKQVLDAQVAYSVTDILSDNDARPAGWNENLSLSGLINASKTGTSNKKVKNDWGEEIVKPADCWTLGYTSKIVTGVWGGNTDGAALYQNASGFSVAGSIWKAFMLEATRGHVAEEFPMPDGMEWMEVSAYSGKIPSEFTPEEQVVSEVFTPFNKPTEVDDVYAEIEIDKASEKLPTEFTPKSAIEKVAVLNFHSQRPDYAPWEEPVQEWLEENTEFFSDAEGIITAVPDEDDDVHTAETAQKAPSIRIVSPVDMGAVNVGEIGVWVDIDAPHGVKKVEYYIEDVLMDTAEQHPYNGEFNVAKIRKRKPFTITAKVFDSLYYAATSRITVHVGEVDDQQKPIVEIIYPVAGSVLPAGITINVQANVYDTKGAIEKANFYFDGNKIGEKEDAPFHISLDLPDQSGEHTISVAAYDQSGNKANESINFSVSSNIIEEYAEEGVISAILEPRDGANLRAANMVNVVALVSQEKIGEIESVDFLAKKKVEGMPDLRLSIGTINEFSSDSKGIFSLAWEDVEIGEYEIYLKLKLKNGEISYSVKNVIWVQ